MGRAEQRRKERLNRLENKKGKVAISPQEINDMKKQLTNQAARYDVEMLMTCFALAEHRLYGYGKKRIIRTLSYIDGLMEEILQDRATIEDYKKELEQESKVVIKCE